MSVEQIKTEILKLPIEEQWKVSMWVSDYLNQLWDEQMESDADDGRLDKLLEEVKNENQKGLTLPFDEGKHRCLQAHSNQSK